MELQELIQKSVQIIKNNQHPSGAYIASPNFSNYAYSWLRDNSYIAVSMNRSGNSQSAEAFHRWVHSVIQRYRGKIDRIEMALSQGNHLTDQNFLFTRYSLEGFEDTSDDSWGNFQYDGYGTWIWSLEEHFIETGNGSLVAELWQSVLDITRYLSVVWRLPAYDCWEEHPDLIHPYSLACAYGGLHSALRMAKSCRLPIETHDLLDTMETIRQYVMDQGVCDNILVKHIHPDPQENPLCKSKVDSSLLGAIFPYRLIPQDSEIAEKTLKAIHETLLSKGGGVYRYRADTYYGGGTWILLTAWLGWVESLMGNHSQARKRLHWIQDQADESGWLPEQMTDEALTPEMIEPWESRWGNVASPLLWSHAMFLILADALNITLEKTHG